MLLIRKSTGGGGDRWLMNIFKITTPVDMNAFFFFFPFMCALQVCQYVEWYGFAYTRPAVQHWIWWLCSIVSGRALVRGVRGQLGCQRVACGQRGWRWGKQAINTMSERGVGWGRRIVNHVGQFSWIYQGTARRGVLIIQNKHWYNHAT
jgi:hypothetical protein